MLSAAAARTTQMLVCLFVCSGLLQMRGVPTWLGVLRTAVLERGGGGGAVTLSERPSHTLIIDIMS